MASLRSGVLVSGLFGVQRGPVLKGRRLVNFANPWLLQRSGFQGFCCLSLAPGMATARVRDHHFDFRTCSLFNVKRRVGGGDARKSHRYLGGSELGLGTGTQTGPPTREKQRPAGSEVGAPAKPAPRSQKEHPPEAENKIRFAGEILDIALLALGGGPIGIAQVGRLGQRPFWCSAGSWSERPPSH